MTDGSIMRWLSNTVFEAAHIKLANGAVAPLGFIYKFLILNKKKKEAILKTMYTRHVKYLKRVQEFWCFLLPSSIGVSSVWNESAKSFSCGGLAECVTKGTEVGCQIKFRLQCHFQNDPDREEMAAWCWEATSAQVWLNWVFYSNDSWFLYSSGSLWLEEWF